MYNIPWFLYNAIVIFRASDFENQTYLHVHVLLCSSTIEPIYV
jgi:hypothetical protein